MQYTVAVMYTHSFPKNLQNQFEKMKRGFKNLCVKYLAVISIPSTMSCIHSSRLLYRPMLRSARIRLMSSSSGSEGDSNDDESKNKSMSSLMDALKGLRVEKGRPGMKIGFSAAAEFIKHKKPRAANAAPATNAAPAEGTTVNKSQDDEDRLHQAAEEVAKIFPDQKKTKSDLLEHLMTAKIKEEDSENISDVLSGIKIEKPGLSRLGRSDEQDSQVIFDTAFSDIGPSDQTLKEVVDGEMHTQYHQRRDSLFDHPRLNIFEALKEPPTDVELAAEERQSIWETEAEKRKRELLATSIRNGFEEMIQMTEEGKLWTYPIDNEKGLEEEQKVPFFDHIFLDKHLAGFPDIPEVMNFMELVLIGLSKNPYLTVQQKIEHIDWFRDYFGSRMDVLQESTAVKS